jgi:hypothetical protein
VTRESGNSRRERKQWAYEQQKNNACSKDERHDGQKKKRSGDFFFQGRLWHDPFRG